MRYNAYYNTMADGTVKQVNPFTGTEVWAVPERGRKPVSRSECPPAIPPDHLHSPEDECSFCEARYYDTSPEKARIVKKDDGYIMLYRLPAKHYFDTTAELRRLPNLFEIISIDYWKKNYGYALSEDLLEWKREYLASPEGRAHVESVLRYKLSVMNHSTPEEVELTEAVIDSMSDAFFGGGHEIVVPRRHWTTDGNGAIAMSSSGQLSPELHFHYMNFAIEAAADIIAHNRHVRYLSVFQNWLAPAGASFDHLHKQIAAIDEWGTPVTKQIAKLKNEPNAFNDFGPNFAVLHNLIVAESEHALACVGIGHRFPTVEVYSKSTAIRPWEHSDKEKRAMSDMVHAIHRALGSEVSCNEEWYYTPLDAPYPIPWHILIKLRLNTLAGFEGSTEIFINPITPGELRDMIVPRLFELRTAAEIARFDIAEECRTGLSPLRYTEAYHSSM